KNRLFRVGYRWFESISLQRRVGCEPDFRLTVPLPSADLNAKTRSSRRDPPPNDKHRCGNGGIATPCRSNDRISFLIRAKNAWRGFCCLLANFGKEGKPAPVIPKVADRLPHGPASLSQMWSRKIR